MKVTLAQLNPIVGDITGNLNQAIRLLEESSHNDSDLLIFSELFLIGYPPKDLLNRPWLIEKAEKALAQLAKATASYPKTAVLIGVPLRTNRKAGKGLANAVALLYQGQIVMVQEKSLLPTYDIFDEARHFDPAVRILTVPFKEEILGISICEDAWNIQDSDLQHSLYEVEPIQELVNQGATLLINLSASPFYEGKENLRYQVIREHAVKHQRPFVFVNQVGGNDEVIFDGGSMIFNHQGELVFLGAFFEEEISTFDLEQAAVPVIFQPLGRAEGIYQALVLGIRDYLGKCGFKKAVIGLSGGIDSALTACLAVAALGAENVLGITMPSIYSSTGSVNDSQILANNLGIECQTISIKGIYQAYLDTLSLPFTGTKSDVTEENIQARIRGNILMAFANKYGYLALSTGNKSELAVGYCTLYGDMSGGLSVISDLPKTIVYELSHYVNRERELIPESTLTKAPSAELKPDQKDQDSLPPYEILDQILCYYIEDNYSVEEIVKLGFDMQIVDWVVRTVDKNEYKRKQAAPGLKVTPKAFGTGRRMPVAMKREY